MPPMEQLRYKPLDHESGTIRLVRLLPDKDEPIRLELISSNLDEEPHIPYEALSYVWGPPNKGQAVEVDGQQLTIRRNLILALLSLRHANEDRILWIDAICINQSDKEETMEQVVKMSTAFARAEKVIVWLGESTPETDVVFHLMQRFEKEAQKYPYKSWGPSDKRWLELWSTVGNANEDVVLQQRKGLASILSRPWFQRIWIAKARAIELACGLEAVSVPIFMVTLSLVGVTPDSPHGQAILAIMSALVWESFWSTQGPDLRKTCFGPGSLSFQPTLSHDTKIVFLKKGTDKDLCNEDEYSALAAALKHEHNETAKLLLENLIKADKSGDVYNNILHHEELRELLPGSCDISNLLNGKGGDGSQVTLTDDTTSSTKNSHTFVNWISDREEYDDMTKVDLGESYRVLDTWAQQERFEDADIRSLISEEDDAASSISMPLPSWASETEHTIVGVFANSSALSPLYSKALQLMPQERFINNFRRLLKAFHGNLVASDDSIVTRQLARLLKSKQRQSRIARRIMVRHVALQGSWNEEDLAAIRDQEKQAYTNVENWLDRTIADTQAARSANTSKELESDDESGTESDEEDEISHFAKYPRLDLVIQKLVKGRPFQDMLSSFKELLLPPGLLKELLPIPRDSITYGTTDETGALSTVQGFLEEITALEWDWWPLSPRIRPLKPSETRVHWKCFCGTNRWRELKLEQQEILEELLKESSANNHPRPLCALLRDTRSASCMKTSSLSQHAASQPHQNAGPNAHIPASSNTASPSLGTQAMRSQPGSNAASQAGGNGPVQPTPASSSSSQNSSGNFSAYNKQLWVNFGVDGSWTPTELDQLGGLNLVSDSAFLRSLSRRHREIRGWFRHYFSFRIISYWEFLRFKRLPLLPPQTIDIEADLPTSGDYEYNPRPPVATRDKPGITKHEFEVYVRLCLDPCWLSSLLMPHKCRTVEDSAVDIVDKIPKYKKLLEQRTQGDEHVWGIRARYVVSGIRVVALHIAILCISFGVWIWWQWKHPDDLQGAAVALTAAFLLISTFWSATGVLRDLR
ncbi:hypothetical protein CUC08_Gglean012488 [Alternaria sp. MG1]|nr:hypothetical protein CUC08_Gglean012488 [Alternaria sp. MG1]